MKPMVTVQLNGRSVDTPEGTTVFDLLVSAEIRTGLVAVEINQEVLAKEEHATRILNDGDAVEAVTLVGGG